MLLINLTLLHQPLWYWLDRFIPVIMVLFIKLIMVKKLVHFLVLICYFPWIKPMANFIELTMFIVVLSFYYINFKVVLSPNFITNYNNNWWLLPLFLVFVKKPLLRELLMKALELKCLNLPLPVTRISQTKMNYQLFIRESLWERFRFE